MFKYVYVVCFGVVNLKFYMYVKVIINKMYLYYILWVIFVILILELVLCVIF